MKKINFKLNSRASDFLVESSLFIVTLVVIGIFCLVAFIGFLYPFPTYNYINAVVEYKNEMPIVAEDGGVIISVLYNNHDTVKMGEPVISLSNTANQKQYQMLAHEVRKANQQLKKSKELQALGSVSSMTVREHQLAVQGLRIRQRQLSSKVIRAPYDGQVYFNATPDELLGNFVFTGQAVGYLYSSEKKVLKIITSPGQYRRYKIGSEIKLFSSELDLKKKQMKGKLYQKLIDREANEMLLYGDIVEGYDDFQEYAPGSEINVGILVTNKSLFEAFFDYDLFSILKQKYDLSFLEKFDKFLLWIQE